MTADELQQYVAGARSVRVLDALADHEAVVRVHDGEHVIG